MRSRHDEPKELHKGRVAYYEYAGGGEFRREDQDKSSYITRRSGRGRDLAIVDVYRVGTDKPVAKHVPKRWAREYILNKLDPSLPKPKKLTPTELIEYDHNSAKVETDLQSLVKAGNPRKGLAAYNIESHPEYLAGRAKGILLDGYIAIWDKKAATELLNPIAKKVLGAREVVDDSRFPDVNAVVPEIELHDWRPLGTSMLREGTPVAWFQNEGGRIVAVDANKLALIAKYVKIDEIKSKNIPAPAQKDDFYQTMRAHASPLMIFQEGELTALLQPMMASIPDKIWAALEERKEYNKKRTEQISRREGHRGEPSKSPEERVTKEEILELQEHRSPQAKTADALATSSRTVTNLNSKKGQRRARSWKHSPGRYDVKGVDTAIKGIK